MSGILHGRNGLKPESCSSNLMGRHEETLGGWKQEEQSRSQLWLANWVSIHHVHIMSTDMFPHFQYHHRNLKPWVGSSYLPLFYTWNSSLVSYPDSHQLGGHKWAPLPLNLSVLVSAVRMTPLLPGHLTNINKITGNSDAPSVPFLAESSVGVWGNTGHCFRVKWLGSECILRLLLKRPTGHSSATPGVEGACEQQMPKGVRRAGKKEMVNWGEYIWAGGGSGFYSFCFTENIAPSPLPGLLDLLIFFTNVKTLKMLEYRFYFLFIMHLWYERVCVHVRRVQVYHWCTCINECMVWPRGQLWMSFLRSWSHPTCFLRLETKSLPEAWSSLTQLGRLDRDLCLPV